MSHCCSGGNTHDVHKRHKSKSIDKDIKATKKQQEYEVKLLLLGAGESGKSTFAKQMKILHMNGWDEGERLSYKAVIYHNLVDSMKMLITVCPRLGITMDESNKERAYGCLHGDHSMYAGIMQDLKYLWLDPGIQEAVRRASEFQFFDSTNYFMKHLDSITDPNYVPTDADILHSRSTTCGIIETHFKVGNLFFRMCDVAGQRSERRKWMHCFSDVKAVIVLVGISEYDQVLAEQHDVNRMHEALKLFGDICNSRWFEMTTMILFLNKIDLFAEKIKQVPLRVCFPEYEGDNSFEATTRYISERFRAANRNANKYVYTHLTCATDTECIKNIFTSVRESIIKDRLALAE